jgi:hypothetical protein
MQTTDCSGVQGVTLFSADDFLALRPLCKRSDVSDVSEVSRQRLCGSYIPAKRPNNSLFINNLQTTTLQFEIPVISDLDPVAQVVESLFIQAWNLFEESKFDEVSARFPLLIYS